MNQKTVNFSKKYRRSRMAKGQVVNPRRRSTLFSVEGSEQLAVESSRARLIQQLTNPDKSLPRDFAAYFHSSTNNSDPAYVVTSHHTRDPLPKRRPVIPTYPCMQSLRWNPHVETSSIDDEPDLLGQEHNMRSDIRPDPEPDMRPEEPKFNCRCENCQMKKCPSKAQPFYAGRSPVLRDNIMTFCDQNTMTPRLNEIGCGCTPIHSTRASDVSVTVSDIAVKDTQACMQLHKLYSPEKCPASILKNNGQNYEQYSDDYSQSHCCEHAYHPPIYCQQPERDIGDDHHIEPSKISSIKSFFKCKKKKDCTNPRRNIYNEGISDIVADRFPVTPVRVPSPTNLKRDCSKSSVRSKCCVNEDIPFSHRTDSRYHQNCKKPNHTRSFYGDMDEVRHLVTSPEITRKTYASRPVKSHKIPSIRMPKRVLTSERDIESYIDRGYPQIMIPVTRRQRGN